jgi:hypothetical protein
MGRIGAARAGALAVDRQSQVKAKVCPHYTLRADTSSVLSSSPPAPLMKPMPSPAPPEAFGHKSHTVSHREEQPFSQSGRRLFHTYCVQFGSCSHAWHTNPQLSVLN